MKSLLYFFASLFFFFFMVLIVSTYITFGSSDTEYPISIQGKYATIEITQSEDQLYNINLADARDMAFALGYNEAHLHSWYLDFYQMASKGRLSEFFGSVWVEHDQLLKSLKIEPLAKALYQELDQRSKNVLTDYAEAINFYHLINGAPSDLRYAKFDLDALEWDAESVLGIWLLDHIISNPIFSEDLSLFALGLELTDNSRNNLFDAIPAINVKFDEILEKKAVAQEALQIQHEWENLSLALGMNTHLISGFDLSIKQSTNHSFYSSRNQSELYNEWIAYRIQSPNGQLEGLSKSGLPLLSVMHNKNSHLIWSIQKEGIGFHQMAIIEDLEAVEFRTESLKVKGSGLHLFERQQTSQNDFILKREASSGYARTWILQERYSLTEIADSFDRIIDCNYREIPENEIKPITFYRQSVLRNDELPMTILPKRPNKEPKKYTRSSFTIDQLRNDDLAVFKAHKDNGFIISHGEIRISDQKQLFSGWRNEPFSMEYLQTELLVLDSLTKAPILELVQSNYSSFAVKLLQETSDVYAKITNDENIGLVKSYFDNWNFLFDETATAASLFEEYYKALIRNTFEDEVSRELFVQLNKEHSFIPVLIIYIMSNENELFDDLNTNMLEKRKDVVTQSLKDAYMSLSREFGTQTEDWRWENYISKSIDTNFIGVKNEAYLKQISKLPANSSKKNHATKGHWSSLNRLQIRGQTSSHPSVESRQIGVFLSKNSDIEIISTF